MSEMSAFTCHFWRRIFVGTQGYFNFLLRILHFYKGGHVAKMRHGTRVGFLYALVGSP